MSSAGLHLLISTSETQFVTKPAILQIHQIRVSVEEIHLRVHNNLRKIQKECDDTLRGLMEMLYDKNKSMLHVTRKDHRCSIAMGEVRDHLPLPLISEKVTVKMADTG